MADKSLKKVIKKKAKSTYIICNEEKCEKKIGFFKNAYQKLKGHIMKYFLIMGSLFLLAGCAGFLPDIAQVVDSIEDTAISVEVNKDAMMEDQDIHITVDLIQKSPAKMAARAEV